MQCPAIAAVSLSPFCKNNLLPKAYGFVTSHPVSFCCYCTFFPISIIFIANICNIHYYSWLPMNSPNVSLFPRLQRSKASDMRGKGEAQPTRPTAAF
ncbi:hypothetical protein AB205_0141060 [Aquarana catesbeiana]|uniref:Uncharacterized protein n=1 Tax=Aquarana catesbeiana TaxID=8400 RepID=A0A2G9SCF2_AQUCT|nr:hypothetical protein AB205_0141060 [Aquarana catesbeiana]